MKKSKLLLWMLAALLLAGCSLARPEQEAEQEDRWVGFYVVPTQDGRDGFYDNPNLEEYGSSQVETDQFGTLTFPQEVLFAVEDDAGGYTFPGLEKGYSLFIHRRYIGDPDSKDRNDLDYAVAVESNMGPGDEGPQLSYTDEGVSETASGTIYYGPPPGVTDWDAYENRGVWMAYRVFQTADGRLYLDGSGNSYSGGGSSFTETRTYTYAENGETVKEDTVTVSVSLQAVPRLEKLVVTQFDENNATLQSDDLNLQNDRPELHCLPETAWVLVEEVSSEGTERTVYDPPEGEDPLTHNYVPLDDEGLGHMAYLNIYAQ